jgi:hypothetical protein
MSPTFQLYMRTGPTPGERFPLEKDEIWLGRDPANDIVIADPEISRRHARFLLRGSTYIVEDMGSTNGTLVNGEMITAPKALNHGDVIEFGEHTSLVFEVTQTPIDETVAVFRGAVTESLPPEPVREERASVISSSMEEPIPDWEEIPSPTPKSKPARRRVPGWVWVVLALLGALLLCGAVALFIIDALNLYCALLPGITNFFFPGACP